MNGIYLLLGSNLGDRLNNLRVAVRLLQDGSEKMLNESSIYETEPWGTSKQGWFLNVGIQLEVKSKCDDLLQLCLKTEQRMGRIRKEKWRERLIDIDILYFDDHVVKTENLTLPHPEIANRKFALIALNELCPQETHPQLGQTQSELLARCSDNLNCRLTEFKL